MTQSMLQKFLVCRERFRVHYVLGLQPHRRWNHRTGYGDAWHVCEEALAKATSELRAPTADDPTWVQALDDHMSEQYAKYPMDREDLHKWHCVAMVQFPEYVKYWSQHPDVVARTPLMQEHVFDVPYKLPSGRTVRLRGKFDSVDLIGAQEYPERWPEGVWLCENKTKGDVDRRLLEKQLKFDLQTLTYVIALEHEMKYVPVVSTTNGQKFPILGVRYNVIRRPFSGGKGSIQQRKDGGAAWFAKVARGANSGELKAGGATWRKVEMDGDQKALVRTTPLAGLDTVVTGKGTWNQLEQVAKSAKPISAVTK